MQNWVYTNYPDYIDIWDCRVTDTFTSDMLESEKAASFYSDLVSIIKSEESPLTETAEGITEEITESSSTSDDNTSSITFSELSMGTYLIIIENGYRVYSPVTVNLLPVYDEETGEWILEDATACAKSTSISITKSIVDDEDVEVINYSTSDIIQYEITADIPTYEEYSISTNYIISDKLDDGLNLDETSIEIYGLNGSSEEQISDSAYTLETSSSGFTVNFVYSEIKEYESIRINYNASLVQSSLLVLGEDGNINTATLTYSNNPYVEESVISKTSNETTIYTYGIEVLKIDNTTKETLSDAEFNLLDERGRTIYFVLVDGIYYEADETDVNSTKTLITNDEGLLYIYGLDAGKYALQETKAPDDYLIATKNVGIEIIDDNLDGIIDEDSDAIYTIEFSNSASFTLPLTGGIGDIIFTIAGCLLILLGIILLIVKKRAHK